MAQFSVWATGWMVISSINDHNEFEILVRYPGRNDGKQRGFTVKITLRVYFYSDPSTFSVV